MALGTVAGTADAILLLLVPFGVLTLEQAGAIRAAVTATTAVVSQVLRALVWSRATVAREARVLIKVT